MKLNGFRYAVFFLAFVSSTSAWALVEGAISGNVTDIQGLPTGNASIELDRQDGTVLKRTETDAMGHYKFFPLDFGDYLLKANISGFAPYAASVHVASGSTTQVDIQLQLASTGAQKEMVITVQAKRHLVQTSQASSRKEITSQQIAELPQGENVSFGHLLASTLPGVVQGTFGQTFIRGNHANIQYQIDGVQLPDSQTNTFGDAFTPRNIDHMEVITGGIPAEYGYHLAAVVNIITKAGPETPGGEAEVNYGSYDTFAPWAVYGGSNEKGDIHYFFSAQYNTTSRGLDTPQPENDGGTCGFNCGNQAAGGTDAIHDDSNTNNQFFKIDWLLDNENKLSLVGFNNYGSYNLPNYPSNFLPTDAMYQNGFVDTRGNTNNQGGTPGSSPYIWTPYNTNDTQEQNDAYLEGVWKHTFTDHSFYQQAMYYKYSNIRYDNDPNNDLLSAQIIANADPASLSENRHVNNIGYQWLDHVQVSTANAGVTYKHSDWRWTGQGLFGSGLRTGPNNANSMPVHFTADTSLGYTFHGKSWFENLALSGDILNITNNAYPVTLANGYNGARYEAGREYFIHLTKEL